MYSLLPLAGRRGILYAPVARYIHHEITPNQLLVHCGRIIHGQSIIGLKVHARVTVGGQKVAQRHVFLKGSYPCVYRLSNE